MAESRPGGCRERQGDVLRGHRESIGERLKRDLEGLPIGVQLVGPFGCDDEVLAAGRWVEARLADRAPAAPG